MNQTNHHIGYYAMPNDVTKPHRIGTAHKRYYEQPITHEPTASDERTNNCGFDRATSSKLFSHQMNHHVCVNNQRPHLMEQANRVEREVANLMADKRITQQQTKASDLQT